MPALGGEDDDMLEGDIGVPESVRPGVSVIFYCSGGTKGEFF